jgi:O-antigen ligase
MVSFEKAQKSLRSGGVKILLPGLLASLIFLLPFERIPSLPVSLFGTSVDVRLSFLVGLVLIGVVGYGVIKRQLSVSQQVRSTHLWLIGFFFSYGLSLLLSTDLKRALSVWCFTAFTALVGVAVGLAWEYRDQAGVRQALRISTWIVLAFGFYQYFGDIFGLSQSWTGLRDIYTKEVFGFPRIQSTGLEPLFYGNFLLIPLFYFANRFLNNIEERPVLLIAIITQIVLTVSRGALFSGAVGLILILLLSFRHIAQWKKLQQQVGLIGLTTLGVVLALLLTNVNNFRVFHRDTTVPTTSPAPVAVINQATNLTSQDDRVRNRTLAWEAFKEHPWLGIGPGNFSAYAKERYVGYQASDGYVVVNNEALELLAEAGIVGFCLFLIFIATILWRLGWVWLRFSPKEAEWAVVVFVYLVALAIQYQTFSTLYIMHIWVMIGIGMGTGLLLVPQKPKGKSSVKKA